MSCVAAATLAACLAAIMPGAGPDTLRRYIAGVLAFPLEQRYQRPEVGDPATLTGAVVLGGGRERLHEAGRLARQWPQLRLLVSGAGPIDYVLGELGPGIDPERVVIETISRTTRDNAQNSALLAGPQAGERWLLVTSAVHMPRAMAAFARVGFRAEAWPVYDLGRAGPLALNIALHEWTGIVWYRLRAEAAARLEAPSWLQGSRGGDARPR
jgi:uncharacterized SAM-binding protein YcdF (DUF218 family)